MIHSNRFTCMLDTNVIYPIEIRDIIFWFAHYNMFTLKWSDHIFDEWVAVMRRKNISDSEIRKRISNAREAFPDANVENYHGLMDMINLPDEKDKHVLAAAIKANADIIVTNNLKHFPKKYLSQFGIEVKSADEFLSDIIDLNLKLAVQVFKELVLNRRNPDLDEFQVLTSMRRNGLTDTANFLHSQLE